MSDSLWIWHTFKFIWRTVSWCRRVPWTILLNWHLPLEPISIARWLVRKFVSCNCRLPMNFQLYKDPSLVRMDSMVRLDRIWIIPTFWLRVRRVMSSRRDVCRLRRSPKMPQLSNARDSTIPFWNPTSMRPIQSILFHGNLSWVFRRPTRFPRPITMQPTRSGIPRCRHAVAWRKTSIKLLRISKVIVAPIFKMAFILAMARARNSTLDMSMQALRIEMELSSSRQHPRMHLVLPRFTRPEIVFRRAKPIRSPQWTTIWAIHRAALQLSGLCFPKIRLREAKRLRHRGPIRGRQHFPIRRQTRPIIRPLRSRLVQSAFFPQEPTTIPWKVS